jgi:diguanylate cyclase (GGDEF)-like protein/PAS domain S-box-containing protein
MDEQREPLEGEVWYRELVNLAPDAIIVHVRGTVVFANPAAVKMMGAQSADEVLGKSVMQMVAPGSREAVSRRMADFTESETPVPLVEEEFVRLDGSVFDVETVGGAVTYDGQSAMLVIVRDVTRRRSAERQAHRLRVAVDASREAIFMTDREGVITFLNPEFTRMYGYTADEVVGKATPRILKSGEMAAEDYRLYWQTLLNKEAVKGELINRTKDGLCITVEGSANAVLDEQGAIVGFLGIQRDITDRKQMEANLLELSIHDVLTGLCNRRFFEEEMARLERGRQFPVSIIMADLNYLKQTNDRDGHSAGDLLLQRAAQVITSAFRAEDIIARIGGDEVAILLPGIGTVAAEQYVRRVRLAIDEHNAAQSGTPLSIAFGVSTAEQGGCVGGHPQRGGRPHVCGQGQPLVGRSLLQGHSYPRR